MNKPVAMLSLANVVAATTTAQGTCGSCFDRLRAKRLAQDSSCSNYSNIKQKLQTTVHCWLLLLLVSTLSGANGLPSPRHLLGAHLLLPHHRHHHHHHNVHLRSAESSRPIVVRMVNVTLLQDALNVSLTTRKAAMELFIEQTEAIDHMNLTEAKRHYGFQDISLSYPLMEQANASEFEDQVHNVTEYVATEAPKIYDSLYILSAVMKRLVQDKLLHRDHYTNHTQYIVEKVDHNMAMAANLSGIPDNTTIDVPSTFNTKYSSPAYGLSMEVIKLLDLISKKYQLALQYLQPAQG